MGVAEQERNKELDDIKTQMNTVEGRRFIYRILKTSGYLDRPAVMTDPAVLSYYGGKQSIGFDLFADVMDVAPKKFPVMILEAKERHEKLVVLLEREKEREAHEND
jgi:hypothetical protein